MNSIQDIIIDSFQGMSLRDIPFVLFRIVVALAMAFILKLIFDKKNPSTKEVSSVFVRLSLLIVVLTSILKASIPLALVFIGVSILLKPLLKFKTEIPLTYLLLLIIIGIGCGSGYVFLTTIGYLLMLIFIGVSKTHK